MTVAAEIENRIVYLSHPDVRWVTHAPNRPGQSCLVLDQISWYTTRYFFSDEARDWLDEWFDLATAADKGSFVGDEGFSSTEWNDCMATSLDHVIDMLADAWVDALEEEG